MKKSAVEVIAGILALVAILVVVFIVVGNNKSKPNKTTEKPTTKITTTKNTKDKTTTNKTTDKVETYNVTYVLDGGTNSSDNPSSFTNKDNITLKNASKDGYEFKGWYKEASFTAKVEKLDSNIKGDITLYAKFEEIIIPYDYEIIYHLDDGENNIANPSGFMDGDTITLLDAYKDGYEFKGWYLDSGFNNKIDVITIGMDYELYARFEMIYYSIDYVNIDGLINPNPLQYTKFDDDITLVDVTKPNNTFKGWYTTSTFDEESKIEVIETSTLTNYVIYAKFEVIKTDPVVNVIPNDLTYNNQEQDLISSSSIAYGGTIQYSLNNIDFSEDIPKGTNAGEYIVYYKVIGDEEHFDLDTQNIVVTIHKATYDMSGIEFNDVTTTYNGNAQPIYISGTLPDGVTVTYENNNNTNVGEYEVIAKFSGDETNYELISNKVATIVINKATYDMSGITFDDVTTTYNGSVQSIYISGDLPTGVTVTYENNNNTNVGEYEVIAKFSGDATNYELISNMTATLIISKATYNMSGIEFNDDTVTYDSETHSLTITGTLPTGVSVTYENNGKINAGTYEVTAKFSGDAINYELIPSKTATLTISKATYDMSGITFDDAEVTYNGETHSLAISGTLPSGVSVVYENNGKINAGEYEVIAKFSGDVFNYETIANKTATLKINKATYDMSGITFVGETLTYDGEAHSLAISGTLPSGVSVTYENNGKINAGTYTVIAKFAGDETNYELIDNKTATLVINKAEYDMTGITFDGAEVTYDGEVHSLAIVGTLPSGVSVEYENNGKINFGTYTVIAKFSGDATNYELIDNMTATLVINKATYDMSGISFEGDEVTYDGETHSLAIVGTLPTGVTVTYENNDKVNANTYTVIAVFTSTNPNYNAIDNMEATLVINKATATATAPSAIEGLVYDGTQLTLINAGSVSVGSIEYKYNDLEWTTQLVKAIFPGSYLVRYRYVLNDNYNEIEGGTVVVNIDKATIDMSGISFNDASKTYTGNELSLEITGELNSNVTVSYEGYGITCGTYNITAKFSVDTQCYNEIDDLEAVLTITPATMTNVTVTGYNAMVDDESHSIVASKTATTVDSSDVTWLFSIDGENWETDIMISDPSDSGTYYFKATAPNHNEYPGSFEVIITEKNVTTIEITNLDSLNKTYDGNEIVTPGINTNSNGEISITYSTDGINYTNTKPVNAGHYTIKVETLETATYAKGSLQKTFDIAKADFDMSSITFSDGTVTYDKASHSLAISGILPDGVIVSYSGNDKVNAGTYPVTAIFTHENPNYNTIANMTATLTINKATFDMSGISFDDASKVYTGSAQIIEITGTLPEGMTVDYEGLGTNVGTYTIYAVFDYDVDNYNSVYPMDATLTITKATYDMSSVTFNDSTITYDKLGHKLTISGTLPDGVTVSYNDTNSYTTVGSYEYIASFSGDYDNYNEIADMTATLTIEKATIDMSEVVFASKTVTYNGNPYSITATNLPHEIDSVTYTNNGQTDAGTYTITASFVYDTDNYNVVDDMTATLTIEKATIDMSGVVFASKTVTYDGNAQSIIATSLPHEIDSVNYTNNGKINAGTYTITASFVYDTDNYNAVEDMTATLVINKKEIDTLGIELVDATYTYDGNVKSLTYSGTLPEGINGVFYNNNDQVNAGEYDVVLTFDYDMTNYTVTMIQTYGVLTILKATIDMIGVSFDNATYTYDGTLKSISISGTLPSQITKVNYTNNEGLNAGTYNAIASFVYDTQNYNEVSDMTATLTINKATPTTLGITVNYDEGIGSFFSTNKTTSSITYNGTYNVNGTILYNDARENLEIGTLSYSYIFAPTDTTNYESVTGTVEIITKATVKYYDGETLLNTLYVAKNDVATNLSLTPKTGYTADGWTLKNVSTLYNFATLVTTNLELYTKYSLITYTITYELDGGTNNPSNPTSYYVTTSTINLLDATKADATFLGWYTDSGFSNKITQIATGSTTNYTLYAKFENIAPGAIIITYHLNGGANSENNPTYYTLEDSAFTLDDATKGTAYTFAGWYLDSAFTQRIITVDPSTMTSNFDVYAKWSALQYSIIYYYGSERITSLSPKSYTIEDAVTLPTYSVYNHTFNGWYLDSALTNRVTSIPAGSTGTVKLYAKLTDNGFTVNFYDTNKTTLLTTKTTSTYGSVTAPSYSYDTATYILKWVDKATNEIVDLTEIDNNYNVYADLIVISYTATVYYIDADGYSTAKTGSPIITSKTISSLTYGSNINLTRQMRVTDASAYDFFYMSPISSFDWSIVVTSLATGTAKLSSDNTCSCYATVDGTTGNIRIYVFCIQAVAIITSSSQTLAFEQNLDMSTSTYQFYSTIDSAFEAFSTQSSKLMRIYGRSNGTLAGNCFGNTSNVTISGITETVDGVSITRPQLIYKFLDYTLTNSYNLTSGKIILPYSRKCTDTTGYRLENTSANSTAHIHSMFAIDKDATLEISISFVIGGDIINGSSLYGRGVVMNNGTLIVAGNTLYSYGFLKGTGNVIINSGATLVDYFYVYDWPGGTNAKSLYQKNVFPFESYSFHNVSCKTRIYAGATLKAWNQLYMASTFISKDMILVGSGGLFQLTSGYIDKSIEETTSNLGTNTNYASSNLNQTVRDVLDIHGNFTDNTVSIEIKTGIFGTITISTSTDMALPIGFMIIKVSEGNGSLSKNSYKFLPGSKLIIEKLGSLTINNNVKVIFYDEYPDDYSYTISSTTTSGVNAAYSYQKIHTAIYTNGSINNDEYKSKLIVNGSLDVKGNLGGKIRTTSATGYVNLSKTSATLPKVLTLNYDSESCTTTDETVNASIYLLNGDAFTWANASATTYSSVEHNSDFGFTQNTNVHSFTITYNYGGNTASTTINSPESTYVIEAIDLFDVEIDGYTFNGWYINQTFTTEALGYGITNDINLYAKLTPIIYNIDYQELIIDDYDGETIINHNPTYFTVEDNISLIPAVCGDLTFYGWFIDDDYSISAPNINSNTMQYYKMIMDGNTIHLYGYFSSVARYSIVYRDQQGLVIDSIPAQQIDGGQSITLAAAMPDYQETEGVNTDLFAYDLYRFSKWQIVSSTGTPIGQFNAGATYTPTSSIIVIPVYTKVATYVSITPGAVSNASYTASFTGGSGSSSATFYVAVGTSVKFTVKYTYSGSNTFTYTPASGSATSNTTVTASYNATVDCSSVDSSCLIEGTLITMADGTVKPVEEIAQGDLLLVFNHETGEYDVSFVLFNDAEELCTHAVIYLEFSNGKTIGVVSEHGFFDLDLNKYVYIDYSNYQDFIGHHFYSMDSEDVILTNSYIAYEEIRVYSPVTAFELNYFTEGMLSMPGGVPGLFNIFDYDNNLKYDSEKMQEDIDTYGLFTYADFEEFIPEEIYEVFNGKYLKVAIAKGLLTFEDILYYVERYSIYW